MSRAWQVHRDKGMTELVDLAHLTINGQIGQDRGEGKFFFAIVQGTKRVIQGLFDARAHACNLITDFS